MTFFPSNFRKSRIHFIQYKNSKMAQNWPRKIWILPLSEVHHAIYPCFVINFIRTSFWSWKSRRVGSKLANVFRTLESEQSFEPGPGSEPEAGNGSWPLSGLKKIKAWKTNLLTSIERFQTWPDHGKPHAVPSITVFCDIKSVLVPSPDDSPSRMILIKGYTSSTGHAMTQ